MSAGQTTPKYRVQQDLYDPRQSRRFMVATGVTVIDCYGSRRVAESYARALNAGVARVDSHAIVGCKVVAS